MLLTHLSFEISDKLREKDISLFILVMEGFLLIIDEGKASFFKPILEGNSILGKKMFQKRGVLSQESESQAKR